MKILIVLFILTNFVFAKDVFNSDKQNKNTIVFQRLDGSKYIMNSNDKRFLPMNNSQDFFKSHIIEETNKIVYFRNENEVYQSTDLINWSKINNYSTEKSEEVDPYENVLLYPNPANDEIRINGMKNWTMQIHDAIGLTYFNDKIENNEISIDISEFPAGCYSVVLKNNTNVIFRRFVKL